MPPVDLTKALIKKRKRSGGGGGSNRPLTPPTGSAHYIPHSHPAPGAPVYHTSASGAVHVTSAGPSPAQRRAARRVKRADRQRVAAIKGIKQARQKIHGPAVFHSEGTPKLERKALARNKKYATPGSHQTKLGLASEQHFRSWVKTHKIPFDVHAKHTDYDMRGYFKATRGAPHKPGQHFPDTFKTPRDTTFSAESKYANKKNPFVWRGKRLINKRNKRIVFSPRKLERKLNKAKPSAKERKVKHQLTKAASKTTRISGPLTAAQKQFGDVLAKKTGLSPRVVGAWMLAENSGSNAVQKEASGYHNWLNIGPFMKSAAFNNPRTAGKATAQFLQGKRWGAGANIPSIVTTAGKSDAEQMRAIENSGFSTTGYGAGGTLAGTYAQVQGKSKPIPKALKRKAVRVLGKKRTRKIISHVDDAKGGLPKGYVNPVEGATTGRTDMGVDFSGAGAKIRAMGKAKVVKLGAPGWPEGGGVLYQLLDGPRKGKYVYNYEGITPTVRVGQTVKAGQQIGTITGSSIEIGWSDASGAPLAHSTYQEGDVTKQGSHFAKFIGGTASAPTTGSGSAVASSSGFGTTGASTASAASSTAAASSSPAKSRAEARHRAQEADRRRRRAASVIGSYRRGLKPIQVATKKKTSTVKKAPAKKIKLGL